MPALFIVFGVLVQGSDVIYDIDRGHKMSLYTHMLKSPISYRNVGAQPTEFVTGRPNRSNHQLDLGPGEE